MNIPKTTKFTLKRIISELATIPDNGFGEKPKQLTSEQKKKLMEMASMFESYGEAIKNEDSIVNSAKALSELCELAEMYALTECGDHFQKNIVERDMKELKRRVVEYSKVTKECYSRMQQLGVGYQDIKHLLGRYYNLDNPQKSGQTVVGGTSDKAALQTESSICASCGRNGKCNCSKKK